MSRQLIELGRHELEVALRTRRVLLVAVLYLSAAILGGLGVAAAFAKTEQVVVESIADRAGATPEAIRAELAEHGDEALQGALDQVGVDVRAVSPALKTSMVAPVFFWCSLAFLPLLVILATFDTVSSELRARSVCYTSMRAPRWAIVAAKGAAWWLLVAVITALATFVVFAGASRLIDSLSLGDALRSATRISIGVLPLEAVWVAIALWCSASTDRPMNAMIRGSLVMVGLRVLTLPNAMVGRVIAEDSPAAVLRYLRWLSPSTYHDGLWHSPDAALLGSTAALLVFAAVFGVVSAAALRRRDL